MALLEEAVRRADGVLAAARPELAPDTVAHVGEALEPHRLCTYLFGLAQAFTAFYEGCPVLGAADAATRASRLALSAATLRVLEAGLGLLGIAAPREM